MLTWQPQLRGSVALCGRGLPAPRRAAGAPARAPASSAHPPGPSGGGGSSLRVPAGQTPSACGHQAPDHPRSPAPSPNSPPHPNARAGPVILFPARPAAASASAPRGGGSNLKTHSPHRVPISIPRPQRQLPESSVLGQLLPFVFRSCRKSRGRETLPAKPVPLPLSAPHLLEDTQGWLPTSLAGESGTGWWRHTPLTSSRSPDIGRPWLPPALSASPDRAEHLSSRNGLSPVQLEIGD